MARSSGRGRGGRAPTAFAIAGDSAGGTIAALACLRMRDEAPEALPRVQALIYANTDLGNSGASMHGKGSRVRTGRCGH